METVFFRCWKVKIVGKKIKLKEILNIGAVPATITIEFLSPYISWFASPRENYLYVQIPAERSKVRNSSSKFYPSDDQRIRSSLSETTGGSKSSFDRNLVKEQ